MSEKTLAIAFLLVTFCLALLVTMIFPEMAGLP